MCSPQQQQGRIVDVQGRIIDVQGRIIDNDDVDSPFNVIICDECHKLKSSTTERAKVVLPMLQRAKRVILLSGTPMLNRPEELYTQVTKRKNYRLMTHRISSSLLASLAAHTSCCSHTYPVFLLIDGRVGA
jgi:hypothetical protein